MKKETKERIIVCSVACIVLILIFTGIYLLFFKPHIEISNMCCEEFGGKYSIWDGCDKGRISHQDFYQGRYNCCLHEVKLNEEGYYQGKACIGITK